MGIKNVKNLRSIFVTFLVKILLGLVLSVLIPVGVFVFCNYAGIINYANSSEKEAMALGESLRTVEDPLSILSHLPDKIKCLVIDQFNNITYTTMNDSERESAVAFVKNAVQTYDNKIRYIQIERVSEVIVLQYHIGSYYRNDYLNEKLPSPEILLVCFMIAFSFAAAFYQVHRLEKRFTKELEPVFCATHEIAQQNLNYEVGHSNIKEFEEVLISFSEMKNELKAALKKQWEIQRVQKEQIAALAHDLKTPLTVTIGNVDLLDETKLDKDQKDLVREATGGLKQISEYVTLLVEMTMASAKYQYQFKKFDFKSFWQGIVKKSEILCKQSKCTFYQEIPDKNAKYTGDPVMLERAVMNIVRNAAEYTPENGKVTLKVEYDLNDIKIQIEDTGTGFSAKMIKEGTKLFIMDDESRNKSHHYGMGLYFADLVIREHHGTLTLQNSDLTGGAIVTIFLKNEDKN